MISIINKKEFVRQLQLNMKTSSQVEWQQ